MHALIKISLDDKACQAFGFSTKEKAMNAFRVVVLDTRMAEKLEGGPMEDAGGTPFSKCCQSGELHMYCSDTYVREIVRASDETTAEFFGNFLEEGRKYSNAEERQERLAEIFGEEAAGASIERLDIDDADAYAVVTYNGRKGISLVCVDSKEAAAVLYHAAICDYLVNADLGGGLGRRSFDFGQDWLSGTAALEGEFMCFVRPIRVDDDGNLRHVMDDAELVHFESEAEIPPEI